MFLRGRRCDLFYILVRLDRTERDFRIELVFDELFKAGTVLWTIGAQYAFELMSGRSKIVDVYREMEP